MEPLFYLTQQYWCHVCRKEFYIRKTESFEEEILCSFLIFFKIYE